MWCRVFGLQLLTILVSDIFYIIYKIRSSNTKEIQPLIFLLIKRTFFEQNLGVKD